jgi:hypothetical protein
MQSKILALSLLALSAAARAETTDCTEIMSVPYFITAPGTYCLKGSVSGSGGVHISADDVVVDLNEHKLEGPTHGVWSSSVVKNVVVRNGTIRAVTYAVQLLGSGVTGDHLVEGLRAEGSIHVGGNGSVVRGNVVTGASIPAANTVQFAIEVGEGTGIRVSDNVIVNSALPGVNESGGIRVWKGIGAAIERNVISDTTPAVVNRGLGIMLQYSKGATVTSNQVVNLKTGISNEYAGYPVLFRDNSVHGAVTPFSGGVIAGSTNYSF